MNPNEQTRKRRYSNSVRSEVGSQFWYFGDLKDSFEEQISKLMSQRGWGNVSKVVEPEYKPKPEEIIAPNPNLSLQRYRPGRIAS